MERKYYDVMEVETEFTSVAYPDPDSISNHPDRFTIEWTKNDGTKVTVKANSTSIYVDILNGTDKVHKTFSPESDDLVSVIDIVKDFIQDQYPQELMSEF